MSHIWTWILRNKRPLRPIGQLEELQLFVDWSRQAFGYVLLEDTLKERKVVGMNSSGKLGHVGLNSDNISAGVENNTYDVCENHSLVLRELRGVCWDPQQVCC